MIAADIVALCFLFVAAGIPSASAQQSVSLSLV